MHKALLLAPLALLALPLLLWVPTGDAPPEESAVSVFGPGAAPQEAKSNPAAPPSATLVGAALESPERRAEASDGEAPGTQDAPARSTASSGVVAPANFRELNAEQLAQLVRNAYHTEPLVLGAYRPARDEDDRARVDAPDGPYTQYHKDGTIAARGQVQRGFKVGRWKTWHPSGKPASDGEYVFGLRHGGWRRWHADGTRRVLGAFVYGERAGDWTRWYENGHVKEQGAFLQGSREGSWREYHGNGQLRLEASYMNGKRHGEAREYHDNGRVAVQDRWVYGRQEERYRAWHPNGVLSQEGTFTDGEPTGTWLSWDAQGEPEAQGD